MRRWRLAAPLLLTVALPSFAQHTVAHAGSDASPRIASLRKDLKFGDPSAIDQFWKEMAEKHTPLLEPIPGDSANLLTTFLWKAGPDTHHVVLFGLTGTNFTDNRLTHLENTDLWYESFKIRKDARFTYAFSPNDSLVRIEQVDQKQPGALLKRISTFRPDPLNPRRVP